MWALPCPLQSRCSGFPELTEVEPDFLVVDKLEEKMSESRGKKSRPAVRGEAQRPWAASGGGAWQGLEGPPSRTWTRCVASGRSGRVTPTAVLAARMTLLSPCPPCPLGPCAQVARFTSPGTTKGQSCLHQTLQTLQIHQTHQTHSDPLRPIQTLQTHSDPPDPLRPTQIRPTQTYQTHSDPLRSTQTHQTHSDPLRSDPLRPTRPTQTHQTRSDPLRSIQTHQTYSRRPLNSPVTSC